MAVLAANTSIKTQRADPQHLVEIAEKKPP